MFRVISTITLIFVLTISTDLTARAQSTENPAAKEDSSSKSIDLADARQCLTFGDLRMKVFRNETVYNERFVSLIIPVVNKCDKKTAFVLRSVYKDKDGFELADNNSNIFELTNSVEIVDPGQQEITARLRLDATTYAHAAKLEMKLSFKGDVLTQYNHDLDMRELDEQEQAEKDEKEDFSNCYRPELTNFHTEGRGTNTYISWDVSTNPQCGGHKQLYYRIEIMKEKHYLSSTYSASGTKARDGALIPTDVLLQPDASFVTHFSCNAQFAPPCGAVYMTPVSGVLEKAANQSMPNSAN